MAATEKRVHLRKNYEAGIVYAPFNTDEFYSAKIFNVSDAGMCFEAERVIRPTSDICIKFENSLPDLAALHRFKFFRAKVKWCQECSLAPDRIYCIGVQYMVKYHMRHGPIYICGLCGETIPYGRLHQTDEFTYACTRCFNHLKSLPDGLIKDSIEDFMIGNVL